jgi:hypothetical protein
VYIELVFETVNLMSPFATLQVKYSITYIIAGREPKSKRLYTMSGKDSDLDSVKTEDFQKEYMKTVVPPGKKLITVKHILNTQQLW